MSITILNDISAGEEILAEPLDQNFKFLQEQISDNAGNITNITTTVTSLSNQVTNLEAPPSTSPSVTPVTGGVEINLLSNSVYHVTIENKTTFVLPAISGNDKLNQILVLLYMPTVYTIDFGTSGNYFGGYAPDMTRNGRYTVIYEHDGTSWYVGAQYKATAEQQNA